MKLLDWLVAMPALRRQFDQAALSLVTDLGERAIPYVHSLLTADASFVERMHNRWLAARVKAHLRRLSHDHHTR